MRYIYARVSTEDQNVDQQVEFLKSKYQCDEVVSEKFTGTTTDRPNFQHLIDQVEKGDTIIVQSVSRLGRKTTEVLETVELLKEKQVSLIVDQLQGTDITSGVGKLLFTMLTGLAELEREQMLERQKIGIERAKAEGKYKGRKPVDSEVIEMAKLLISQGHTRKQVAARLGVGTATLYRYLKEE